MPDHPTQAHLGRLHILSREEILSLFYLPKLTDEERFSYFSLTETEFDILSHELRSLPSKLNFVLQLGYFKSRRLFFNFEFSDIPDDVEFVRRRYFPNDFFEICRLPKIAVNTLLKHRRRIAELYNYQFCGGKERENIERIARNAAQISVKPIFIFREILAFLETNKIILPGYSFLQDAVSKALNYESERLQTLLQNELKEIEIKQHGRTFDRSCRNL